MVNARARPHRATSAFVRISVVSCGKRLYQNCVCTCWRRTHRLQFVPRPVRIRKNHRLRGSPRNCSTPSFARGDLGDESSDSFSQLRHNSLKNQSFWLPLGQYHRAIMNGGEIVTSRGGTQTGGFHVLMM